MSETVYPKYYDYAEEPCHKQLFEKIRVTALLGF